MGPGPVDVYPRVLRAMSVALQGQFDPQFTAYMNADDGALPAGVPHRQPLDLADRRHGQGRHRGLPRLHAGARRQAAGADLRALRPSQGRDRPAARRRRGRRSRRSGAACSSRTRSRPRSAQHRPRMLAISHGDTSTTMLQPLAEIGALCRRHDVLLYVDCTASLGGNPFEMDAWQIDVGLGRPAEMPVGAAGLLAHHVQRPGRRGGQRPQACRAGHQGAGHGGGQRPHHPLELLRPRHADGLLVAEAAQPPHRGRLHALCGARMRPRRAGARGWSAALRATGSPAARCGRASRPWGSSCSAMPSTAWPT